MRRFAVGLLLISVGACAPQPEAAKTACQLVPKSLMAEILLTDAPSRSDQSLQAGKAAECTLSADDGQRIVRYSIRFLSEDEKRERSAALRSGPLNSACSNPERFTASGGVGVVCQERASDGLAWRATAVLGNAYVTTAIVSPADAAVQEPSRAWQLAVVVHRRWYTETAA